MRSKFSLQFYRVFLFYDFEKPFLLIEKFPLLAFPRLPSLIFLFLSPLFADAFDEAEEN